MLLSSFTHPHHHISPASLASEVWSTFVSFRKCSPNNSGKWLILYDLCVYSPKTGLYPIWRKSSFWRQLSKRWQLCITYRALPVLSHQSLSSAESKDKKKLFAATGSSVAQIWNDPPRSVFLLLLPFALSLPTCQSATKCIHHPHCSFSHVYPGNKYKLARQLNIWLYQIDWKHRIYLASPKPLAEKLPEPWLTI